MDLLLFIQLFTSTYPSARWFTLLFVGDLIE